MRLVICLLLLGLPGLAWAKSWKGITPGSSGAGEVVKRFGEPTRRLDRGKKHVLAYTGDEAIAGARQAEFIVGEDGKVEQIAVFPEGVVERAAIEETYGPDCAEKAARSCFVRKVSDDDFKTYYWYQSLGLVIFFNSDAKTVQSFLYVKPSQPRSEEPAAGQPPRSASAAHSAVTTAGR